MNYAHRPMRGTMLERILADTFADWWARQQD